MNSPHYEKYKDLYKRRAKERAKDKLYTTYLRMCERCSQGSNNPNYRLYRERGIKVLFESPGHFKEWSKANGWQEDLTIDRIDPHGHYSPENCRWITHKQNSGRASAKKIQREDGRIYESLAEAARQHGVSGTAIRIAIKRGTRSGGYYWNRVE